MNGNDPKRRSWDSIVERLNRSNSGRLRIPMGSPGSAQVTRVRLLRAWNGLAARTVGSVLVLTLLRP